MFKKRIQVQDDDNERKDNNKREASLSLFNDFKKKTDIEREEAMLVKENENILDELSSTSDEDGIMSLSDLKNVEFSTTVGFQKGKNTKLAEELNLFKMETPSIQVKDFTEDFTVESPIAEFVKSINKTKQKKDEKHNSKSVIKSIEPNQPSLLKKAIQYTKWRENEVPCLKRGYSQLEHHGIQLTPYIPHHIPLEYKKKRIELTPDQEELVNAIAPTWNIESTSNKEKWLEQFNKFDEEKRLKNVKDINMNQIAVFLIRQSLQKEKKNEEYAIIDNMVVQYKNKSEEVSIQFDSEKGPMIQRYIPENIIISGDLQSPIPPCNYDGHNWEDLDVKQSIFLIHDDLNQLTIRVPSQTPINSYKSYLSFQQIHQLAPTVLLIQQFIDENIQSEDLHFKELATLYWFEIFLFVNMIELSVNDHISLQCKDIEITNNQECLIQFSARKIISFTNHQYKHAEQVIKNLADFCQDKKEDDFVFSIYRYILKDHQATFFPSFNLNDYQVFMCSIFLQKFLKEPIPASLSIKEKSLLLQSVKKYIYCELISHKKTRDTLSFDLAKKYITIGNQLESLHEMEKKRKKGKEVRILTEEEKELLETPDETPDEKKLESKYKKYEKKMKKESSTSIMSYQEWKELYYQELERKKKEREERRNECIFLFEKQPSVKEVKHRIKEYKKKLEDLDKEIQEFGDNTTNHSGNYDPRIIVAWRKRNDCLQDSFFKTENLSWAYEVSEDYEY